MRRVTYLQTLICNYYCYTYYRVAQIKSGPLAIVKTSQIFHNFTAKSFQERILKIGLHFAELQTRVIKWHPLGSSVRRPVFCASLWPTAILLRERIIHCIQLMFLTRQWLYYTDSNKNRLSLRLILISPDP